MKAHSGLGLKLKQVPNPKAAAACQPGFEGWRYKVRAAPAEASCISHRARPSPAISLVRVVAADQFLHQPVNLLAAGRVQGLEIHLTLHRVRALEPGGLPATKTLLTASGLCSTMWQLRCSCTSTTILPGPLRPPGLFNTPHDAVEPFEPHKAVEHPAHLPGQLEPHAHPSSHKMAALDCYYCPSAKILATVGHTRRADCCCCC